MLETVVIHQPNFLPRTKVLIKILLADVWIVYNDVQYVRREWQNRVFLEDSCRNEVMFTAKIKKADYKTPINMIKLHDVTELNNELLNFIQYNYSKAPYYGWIKAYIDEVIKNTNGIEDLSTYNIICTKIAIRMMEFEKISILSSDIILKSKERNEKLIELCKYSGCNNYICGSGGKSYIDEGRFQKDKINVVYYDYSLLPDRESLEIGIYKNRSFLDFIAYNGINTFSSIVSEAKKTQVESKIMI